MDKLTIDPRKRTLTITLTDASETMTFTGTWTGQDIKKVSAHIPRQYRLYMRTVRRTETGVPIGPSNIDRINQFNEANNL